MRPDHEGALLETQTEIWNELGEIDDVVARLLRIDEEGSMKYGFSYHLLAASLFKLGRTGEAAEIIERGMIAYPGDSRLGGKSLGLLEQRFHEPLIRKKFKDIFLSRDCDPVLLPRITFLKAVRNYYENRPSWSNQDFASLRNSLRFASGKIRLNLADAEGLAIERDGICTRRGAQVRVKSQQLGDMIVVSNPAKWSLLGHPVHVIFTVGFSFQGTRARILAEAFPASE